MVVIYAPTSTDGASLREYCMRPDGEDFAVVSDADVPLRAVRAGKVEVVLASSLKGLGRSVSHLVELLREFVTRKVNLIIPGQGIDTSKVPGKVFLDTLDAISEFKHSAAVEAIHAGLNRARRRGVRLGRPETVNAHCEDVARLRSQGRTWSQYRQETWHPEFDSVQDYWPTRRRRAMSQVYGARTASYRESRKLRTCLFCSSGSSL